MLDGSKRINMNLIKEYSPFTKNEINKNYYQIELILMNDSKVYLHCFDDKEKRDEMLNLLDENLLIKTP